MNREAQLALLHIQDLKTAFHTRDGIVRAVNGISFDLHEGEILGIVGESGSGKSVTCYSFLGLVQSPPGCVENGVALFEEMDLLKCTPKDLRKIRGNHIAMIFQDPMSALNPYLPIGIQLAEPLLIHKNVSRRRASEIAMDSLREVGIQGDSKRLKQYPHQFSGGMRQRIMIAMALITEPKILIADEPTTALDVTIQAQILDLIKRMQKRNNASIIFITHNLGVIAGMADRVLVMYAGSIVESGPTEAIYYSPAHPYTRALLDAILPASPFKEGFFVIPGHPPDNAQSITGCAFAPRCLYAAKKCEQLTPAIQLVDKDHSSACLRIQDGTLQLEPVQRGKV